ncbi:MAG: PAS domain S-box protein [Candidatus Heimdallarchaeaceae archaeon]|jgi:PAS domain S-box-containing protein
MNSENDINLFQETFDTIFQNSLDMIMIVEPEGKILDANIQACRYFGITLAEIKQKNISKFIKEKKQAKDFLVDTTKSGTELKRFTFVVKDKEEIIFHLSSTYIQSPEFSYIVLICRDIQAMIDSALQRQFFFELFQHDLLNKLHAEIGYIDFFQRLYKIGQMEMITGQQMLEKMRDITVKSIYLIQNANISLLIEEDKPLTNQTMSDVINHAVRYLKNFFSSIINIEVVRVEDLIVLGDEFLSRVFVNLIVRMLEYTEGAISVEITVDPPVYETSRIRLHFEDVVLSEEEKLEILQAKEFDRRKLDIAVIQSLLQRYQIRMKIEDVKRMGNVVGTRMILKIPVAENRKKATKSSS